MLFVDLQLEVHAQACAAAEQAQGQDEPQRSAETGSWTPPPAMSCTPVLRACPTHNEGLPRRLQSHRTSSSRDDGDAYILDWSHATQGNASGRCGAHLPAVLARGRHRPGGEVPRPVLQKERHRQAVCAEVDFRSSRRQPDASRVTRGGARVPRLHWVNVVDYQ